MSIKRRLMNIIISCLPIKLNEKEINIYECEDYYTTDVAMVIANKMGISVDKISSDIKNNIKDDLIKVVEIADSGYINIYLKQDYLYNILDEIKKKGKKYGKNNYGAGSKINIDYGILNCDDVLSTDYLRRIIYCDSISNILSFCGYDVVRNFFIKDYNADSSKKIFDEKKLKNVLDKFRISFDFITKETDLINRGITDSIISELQRSGNCIIDKYALFVKINNHDELNLQIVDEDGNYDAPLFDVSYYADKLNNGYDKVYGLFELNYINYVDKIMSCLEKLNYDINIFIFDSFNSLNEDNYDLDVLINGSDVNIIRYSLLNNLNRKNQFIFDNINNIERTYLNIFSLLRKKQCVNNDKFDTMNNKCAYTIMNKLMEFEDVVIAAADDFNPCIVKKFISELSCLLNNLYSEFESGRYFDKYEILLEAALIVMNNASSLLGLILREDF